MSCWGAAGNVIAYNYSIHTIMNDVDDDDDYPWMSPDLSAAHGAYPMMNLFEGNHVGRISADYYWGTAGYQMLFRNRASGYQRNRNKSIIAVTIQKRNLNNTLMGNVLGVPIYNYPYSPAYESEGVVTLSNTPEIYRLGYEQASDGDPAGNDPLVKETLLRHGNFDYVTNICWSRNGGKNPGVFQGNH